MECHLKLYGNSPLITAAWTLLETRPARTSATLRWGNAVREAIQNSLDARQDGIDQVGVTFTEVNIPQELIGAGKLRLHLEQCLLRADSEDRSSLRATYQRALDNLVDDPIRCLKIHDTGTTGLRGVNWDALVLQEGAVEKQNSRTSPGGSYGIGKNAVLNVSDLMTVFYSTRYVEGRKGRIQKLQGKATLMTHPDPESPRNSTLQHIGFYRNRDQEPITGVKDVPPIFQLEETGTGIYVIGFNPRSQDWISEMRAAVITNFFHCIHNQKLEVAIKAQPDHEIIINHQTLDIEFETFTPGSPAHHYYRAIRRPNRSLQTVVNAPSPIGPLEVYLLTGIGPRRTAYINQNGMLISDSRDQQANPLAPVGRNLWPDYTTVVIPATKEGATFLGRLENPSHSALSPKQLTELKDQTRARDALRASRVAIRSLIDDTVSKQHGDRPTNITELNHRFPELDHLLDQNLTTQVIPNSEVVATLDSPPDEADPTPSTPKDTEPPAATINQPRIIPTSMNEAVLAFNLSSNPKETVQVVLKPAGEEPMNQKLIVMESAEVLSPPDTDAYTIDGALHLPEPPQERITVRVTTSTDIEHMAIQLEVN